MRLNRIQKYKLGLEMLGLTQQDLADKLGFAKSYINLLIHNKRQNKVFTDWMDENVLTLFDAKRGVR